MIRPKHFRLCLILLCASVAFTIDAQNYQDSNEPTHFQTERLKKSNYGLNLTSYRDFATSPLYYSGLGITFQTEWLKVNDQKESNFYLGGNLNILTAEIPKSEILDPSSSGFLIQFKAGYEMLWNLSSISSEKYTFKAGGDAKFIQNTRVNPSLLNNASGFENFIQVAFSGEAVRDVSRNSEKQSNFLFFKKTLPPAKRNLRFGMSVGLLNLNYRPGYAYLYEDERDGMIDAFKELTSGYTWTMNGWTLGTEIEYIIYHPGNDGAHSWTYAWNATNAPGKYDTFQMASHQLTYSRYILRNKRQK